MVAAVATGSIRSPVMSVNGEASVQVWPACGICTQRLGTPRKFGNGRARPARNGGAGLAESPPRELQRLLPNEQPDSRRDLPKRREQQEIIIEKETDTNLGEMKGLCIGYSKSGTSGSGMGPELRQQPGKPEPIGPQKSGKLLARR